VSRWIVSGPALAALRSHLEAAYPEEGCGILVGEERGEERHVRHAIGVENVSTQDRTCRYEIHPECILDQEWRARAVGLEVIGFFHSHPEHPPEPSAFDRERAWPYYAYVIASVERGRLTGVRCWRLAKEGGLWEPQPWSVDESQERAQPQERTAT
jgi:proteasome lid subunit RPN8/RPN11